MKLTTTKIAKGEYKVNGYNFMIMENSEPDKNTENYWFICNNELEVVEVEVNGEKVAAFNSKAEALKALSTIL